MEFKDSHFIPEEAKLKQISSKTLDQHYERKKSMEKDALRIKVLESFSVLFNLHFWRFSFAIPSAGPTSPSIRVIVGGATMHQKELHGFSFNQPTNMK